MNINDVLAIYLMGYCTKEQLKTYLEDVGFSREVVNALIKKVEVQKEQVQHGTKLSNEPERE